MRFRLKHLWKSLGPGLITGAADNDPSAIAIYAISGARFGYAMLWILLWMLPFMIAIQSMCARIGALSGCGLAGNIRRHYPAWILVSVVVAIVVTNTVNIGANVFGMASALNLVIPIPVPLLAIASAVITMLLVVSFRYRTLERIFKWFALSLFVYGIALLMVHSDWRQIVFHTIVPSGIFTKEFFLIAFAMFGTTLSPYLYFWLASQEAEELKQDHPGIRVCKFRPVKPGVLTSIAMDTRIGMIISNLIAFFIVALTASTIFSAGTQGLESLRDAAQALEPLAGPYASILFMVGIVGSGLLAIPVLAGSAAYALGEMFGWQVSLDRPFNRERAFYLIMFASIALGMVLPFTGITPIQALFWTALLMAFTAPFLIAIVAHMANNPDIVGPHRSPPVMHALGMTAMALLLAGAVYVVIV